MEITFDEWNKLERNAEMKKNIILRDLTPLKDVTGGRRHKHRHARGAARVRGGLGNESVGEGVGSLGPFGLWRDQ